MPSTLTNIHHNNITVSRQELKEVKEEKEAKPVVENLRKHPRVDQLELDFK
jgi:hypothetical protein